MRRGAITVLALAALLSGCGRTRSTADWLAQLHASDSAARLHALKALGDRVAEAPEVVPALAEALRDPDAFVRREAARSLGRIGPEARPAVPALVIACQDRHPRVRKAAAEALRKIDPGATDPAGRR